jgi:hypothetical protein
MKTQAEIEALADQKLKEADCLLKGGFYDGAYYMGGYCVELLLKARVCKTLNINDFFLFNRGKQEAYKPYKSHDYDQLLILSGLFGDFSAHSNADPLFKAHWSVVSTWNEGSRYLTGKSSTDAQSFLISVNEVATWIRKHL